MRKSVFLGKYYILLVSFISLFLYVINYVVLIITVKANYSRQLIAAIGAVYENHGFIEKKVIDNLMSGNLNTLDKGEFVLKKYGYFLSGQGLMEHLISREILIFGVVSLLLMLLILLSFQVMFQNHVTFLKKLDRYIKDLENPRKEEKRDWDYGSNSYTRNIMDQLKEMSLSAKHNISLLQKEKEKMRDFMEDLSHQMKTPLTVAHLCIERYLIENAGRKNDKLEQGLKQMEKITLLINAYLKIGMLKSGNTKLEISNNRVSQFLEEAAEEVQPLLDSRNVELFLEGDEEVVFDFDAFWMKEAITNLLKNSIEHSEEDSSLWISFHRGRHELVIQVQDEGCGIEEGNLPTIFERFTSSIRQRDGSNGLGLSIAKQAVARHFGQIQVRNNKDRGVTFEIRLPILRGKEVYNECLDVI